MAFVGLASQFGSKKQIKKAVGGWITINGRHIPIGAKRTHSNIMGDKKTSWYPEKYEKGEMNMAKKSVKGGWITINGRHIPIGAARSPKPPTKSDRIASWYPEKYEKEVWDSPAVAKLKEKKVAGTIYGVKGKGGRVTGKGKHSRSPKPPTKSDRIASGNFPVVNINSKAWNPVARKLTPSQTTKSKTLKKRK